MSKDRTEVDGEVGSWVVEVIETREEDGVVK